jgi:histidyl-tRNA synthetase
MSQTLQAVRGMNDILPAESPWWEHFEAVARDWLAAYGYRNMRMPLLEPTALFRRAIGEVTDIVEKEMYSFVDELNGEHLTLRPEGTASCVRAAIEHKLLFDGGKRLWYAGPMFRHERPQKGRYRQFHQIGVEALGYPGPDIDAEHIIMGADLWQRLGVSLDLQINTLGSPAARTAHRSALVAYLEAHVDQLDAEGQRRLHTNPLRVLDSKNPAMQPIAEAAPRLLDYLSDTDAAHFETLKRLLDENGIAYRINPRLVRGLDYYHHVVYEWVTDQLGAQGTVCAGGRYDGLVEQLGGKPAPACGFALGVERLLALMQESGQVAPAPVPDAYLVHQGEAASPLAWRAARALREAGMRAVLHMGGGSFKSQMKKADASGARFALIVGDDEAASGMVSVKPLRATSAQEQQRIALDALATFLGQEHA